MLDFNRNRAITKANHKIVLLFSLIVFSYNCVAQDLEPGRVKSSPQIFILPAHTHLKSVPWRDSIYYFPNFQLGKVSFQTGYSPEATMLLNYNLYLGRMAMINFDGDTVDLPHSKDIKVAMVGDHIFFHDYKIGFIEVIQQLPVALGVLKTMTIHTESFQGNKDGTSYGSDVRGTPSAYARYYQKVERYYIIGKNNKVYKATPASILKLFNAKDEINTYLSENKPDFEKKDDLLMLMQFCNEADSARKN